MPSYTTERSGLGHLPVFTCTVELAGITFTGDPAKNKKQAEKNAASAAWSALKQREYYLSYCCCSIAYSYLSASAITLRKREVLRLQDIVIHLV